MSNAEVQGNNTWGKFSAFRVLGDHEPMPGFRLVMQFAPRAEAVARLLEVRADGNVVRAAELLDVSRPTLYDMMHRFGLK